MTHEIRTKLIVANGGTFVLQRRVGKQRWKHLTDNMVAADRVVDLFETASAFYFDIVARRSLGTTGHCKLQAALDSEKLTYVFTDGSKTIVDIFSKDAVEALFRDIVKDVGIVENILVRTLRKDFLSRIVYCQRETRGYECESFLHFIDRSPVMVSGDDIQELMRLQHNSDRRFSKPDMARKSYLPNRKEA